ncbi:hypothetical protein Zmor_004214 [Zophobas morio]|uniref:Reverse transcriptase Ty1/copia-type domain-containing protein n=1 Tax=Zophobas morio TaxID=2755281 RepID=A0AA38HK04_9CUCU|nr:hypothetical protein Zmor_004214 [Zophobas morio]
MDVKLLVKIPKGIHLIYQGDLKGKCLSLNKAFYRVKQAWLLWFKLITKIFIELGFKQPLIGPFVFYSIERNFRCIIPLYVDDMRILIDDAGKVRTLIASIGFDYKEQQATNLSALKYPRTTII